MTGDWCQMIETYLHLIFLRVRADDARVESGGLHEFPVLIRSLVLPRACQKLLEFSLNFPRIFTEIYLCKESAFGIESVKFVNNSKKIPGSFTSQERDQSHGP